MSINETPLSSFNNFLLDINNYFENLFFEKSNKNILTQNNLIIFENDKLILFGYLKLIYKNQEVFLQITKPLNINEIKVVNKIYENWDNVCINFLRYIQMYILITKNYDDVPKKLIDLIIANFENINYKSINQNLELPNFLIPFKNKIYKNVDDDKKYIENIFEKYQYVLKINIKNNTNFEYKIYRVLSSNFDENKSLDNVKYLEQDIIKKDTLKSNQFKTFIEKLFYYGEII